MAWRDELRKVTVPPAFAAFSVDLGPIRITVAGDEREVVAASFRGVPFFVETASREGGRRLVRHEFPLRPDPQFEDLGRKARTYKLDGYVIGPEYLKQKGELVDALEDKDEAGPGTLIHPYYGELQALCTKYTIQERRDDGGMASVSIEFEEVPKEPPFSVSFALPSLLGAILGAIAAVIAAAAAIALAVVLTALAIRSLIRAVEYYCDALASLFSFLTGDDAALFRARVESTKSRASVLITKPDELLTEISTALDGLQTATDQRGLVDKMLDVYAADLGALPPKNTDYASAFFDNLRRIALFHAARAAGRATFDSQAAAVATRTRITDLMDTQELTATVEVYDASVSVRTELARLVPPHGSDLPDVVKHRTGATTNALVLSYRLYGTVSREADIVTRNGIHHPGFIPAGTELEVLSHADE